MSKYDATAALLIYMVWFLFVCEGDLDGLYIPLTDRVWMTCHIAAFSVLMVGVGSSDQLSD